MNPSVLINGRPATALDVADRGCHYGDGVFETIAVSGGEPLLWDRHLERLQRGCAHLGIVAPLAQVLTAEARQLVAGRQRAVLKILVTRGPAGRGYAPAPTSVPSRVLLSGPWPDYPAEFAREGVAVRWCAMRLARQPRLAGIKHLNRLEQVLARSEWTGGEAEGLMRDTEGYVIEGTMSNVFAVVRGTLLTPELSQCGVAGVMRAQVIAQARAAGLVCRETVLQPADIESADEIFLTNSLIGLWPVRSLDHRSFPLGPITQQIRATLASAGAVALAP